MEGLTRSSLLLRSLVLACSSCAAAPSPAASESTPAAITAPPRSTSAGTPSSAPAAPVPKPAAAPPDAATIYARIERDLRACYDVGHRTTPEMVDGRVTLVASVDATGTPSCVIPSDHTGLTQDVEDCMSARLAAERFDAGPAWSASVPIVLRGGALKLGERKADASVLESVETIRMPDAFDTLDTLEAPLQACLQGVARSGGPKSMVVAARVGADGHPVCALATSAGHLPAAVGACAAGVLRGATFPAPKRGSGLVIVPLLLP